MVMDVLWVLVALGVFGLMWISYRLGIEVGQVRERIERRNNRLRLAQAVWTEDDL